MISHVNAQANDIDSSKRISFSTGIYLENYDVTIPWDLQIHDVRKYGKPKIDTLSKRKWLVSWDSVKILNGITVNLKCHASKGLFGTDKYSKMDVIIAEIDPRDFDKIQYLLAKYATTGYAGTDKKNVCHYFLDNCYIILSGNYKHFANRIYIQRGVRRDK